VSVVDVDESVRESLPDLLRELGFAAKAFASSEHAGSAKHVSLSARHGRD
jgi:FixJ family two-component response regulator